MIVASMAFRRRRIILARSLYILRSRLLAGMRLLSRTAGWRSIAAGTAVIFVTTLVVSYFTYRAALTSAVTSQELVTLTVARRCADYLERQLPARSATGDMRTELKLLADLNPTLDLYLLDRHGIVVSSSTEDRSLDLPFVDLRPIRRALVGDTSGGGDDPRARSSVRPFSVAPIKTGDFDGYLYIMLRTETADLLRGALTRRVLLVELPTLVVTTLLASAILGSLVLVVTGSRTVGIETFVSQVSHDLRGPLGSIQASLENLVRRNQLSKTEENVNAVRSVAASSRTLVDLLEGLAQVTKLDGLNLSLKKEPLSATDLLSDLAAKYRAMAEAKGVRLMLSAPDSFPLVRADAALLDRAFSNIVENAIKFTPPGGIVTLRGGIDGKKLFIEVEDTGSGIPAEDLAFVFERFYRARNSAGVSGSGLGLGIAKKIFDLHRGGISIASTEGRGTTVRCRLPMEA